VSITDLKQGNTTDLSSGNKWKRNVMSVQMLKGKEKKVGAFCLPKCHGLTKQLATKHQTAARSPFLFPLSRMGRRNGQRRKLVVEIKTV